MNCSHGHFLGLNRLFLGRIALSRALDSTPIFIPCISLIPNVRQTRCNGLLTVQATRLVAMRGDVPLQATLEAQILWAY